MHVFLIGFASSLALIVAIGAQNAFVLRQGLKRQHVLWIVSLCTVVDPTLIAAGVAGLGSVVQRHQSLLNAVRFGGAAFLLAYGALAFRRALRPSKLDVNPGGADLSLRAAILATLGFTFLNPHMYLDTIVLLGTIGAQQPSNLRLVFVLGAAAASAIWFFGLGFGARLLTPLFARPAAWRVLDVGIGAIMVTIAIVLVAGA